MERPLWDRIQEIYYSTLPMPQSERSAFIASACEHDPFLVREVTELLKADDDSADSFLKSPVFELGLKIISSNGGNGSSTANGSADSLIGTTIKERYLVERELGQGGIGKVYRARDLTLHSRPVVIKVLLEASVKDAYMVRKFRQEVEALARIDHPGVVNVLGAGELQDGKPFIVMQYVSGLTLRSQIPMEGMDLERAAIILKQIGAALDYVHAKGIFHRDLKPDNIMLQSLGGDTELVKVVDFGIAKVKDSVVAPSTVDKVSVGTVVYMSPEQLRGGERITAASDIYSMGVMAYEMVTGRRPFNPTSAPRLLEMHRDGVRVKPIDLRPSLSTEAQAIILRSLAFERTARYQSAAEFGDCLSRALLNEEETAPKLTIARPATDSDYSRRIAGGRTFQVGTYSAETPIFPEPDDFSGPHKTHSGFKLGKIQLAIIGGFLIVLISVSGVLWNIKTSGGKPEPNANTQGPGDTSAANPPQTRSFNYLLNVQRMRNNRRYQNAFASTGQDVFDTGDKFQLRISSSSPGYVYVFNEGSPERNGSSFTLIYPTPAINNGSATVGADQWAETNWNTFQGRPGSENLWMAWSSLPVPELEAAKNEAFNSKGVLSGQSLDTVKAFLTSRQEESKAKINRDQKTQETTVRGTGDVVVRMLQLKHR